MKRKVEYKNRYRDLITFEYKAPDKVIMTGGEYFRWGYPNDYTEAYEKYCSSVENKEGICSISDFIETIHDDFCFGGPMNPLARFRKYIKSNKSIIDMVDPSGGPYLHSGHDMNDFGFGRKKPMIIDRFEFNDDGTKTIFLK